MILIRRFDQTLVQGKLLDRPKIIIEDVSHRLKQSSCKPLRELALSRSIL